MQAGIPDGRSRRLAAGPRCRRSGGNRGRRREGGRVNRRPRLTLAYRWQALQHCTVDVGRSSRSRCSGEANE